MQTDGPRRGPRCNSPNSRNLCSLFIGTNRGTSRMSHERFMSFIVSINGASSEEPPLSTFRGVPVQFAILERWLLASADDSGTKGTTLPLKRVTHGCLNKPTWWMWTELRFPFNWPIVSSHYLRILVDLSAFISGLARPPRAFNGTTAFTYQFHDWMQSLNSPTKWECFEYIKICECTPV